MTAQELYYEHRDELTKEALQVLEKVDNYTLSTSLIDGDASDFNAAIAEDPHSYDVLFNIKDKDSLTDAYARHLFDEFGVDCGLYHNGSDLDLNFEDFDECIRNTPKDQLTEDYYKYTIEDFVEERLGM